jgi:hypothetical protein
MPLACLVTANTRAELAGLSLAHPRADAQGDGTGKRSPRPRLQGLELRMWAFPELMIVA